MSIESWNAITPCFWTNIPPAQLVFALVYSQEFGPHFSVRPYAVAITAERQIPLTYDMPFLVVNL